MSGDPSMLLGCSLWFYIQQPLSAFSYLICRIRTDALPLQPVSCADWLGSRTVLCLRDRPKGRGKYMQSGLKIRHIGLII